MEAELNIANILKDKQKGTKLYTDAFGELNFEYISNNIICTRTKEGMFYSFYNDGKYDKNGEPILVPSKKMHDWSKFAWKKGDVLVSQDKNIHLIFEKFTDDTYTIFAGKHCYEKDFRNEYNYERRFDSFMTEYFTLETDDTDVQTYIRMIENKLGGKLNLKTLEIEKQQEFKDGDIITITTQMGNNLIFIFKAEDVEKYYCHAFLYGKITIVNDDSFCKKDFCTARLSTEEEQKQFFDALAKKGKAWDAKNKKVIDLKPKWIPKPFDRVVTRVDNDAIWTANIFSHIDSYGEYNTIGCVGGYPYCLPYNEETAKLIGTTDDWKG